jgi:hypothetical protein
MRLPDGDITMGFNGCAWHIEPRRSISICERAGYVPERLYVNPPVVFQSIIAHAAGSGGINMDRQKKTAAELEEIMKLRIGAGDFRVTVHPNPETGWHATIYGRQPTEVHRCQVMADTIATELCQHYDLQE